MPSRSAARFWRPTAAVVAPAADDGASGFGYRFGIFDLIAP
jgi:hypothetical protein